jgi:hypothetical protein
LHQWSMQDGHEQEKTINAESSGTCAAASIAYTQQENNTTSTPKTVFNLALLDAEPAKRELIRSATTFGMSSHAHNNAAHQINRSDVLSPSIHLSPLLARERAATLSPSGLTTSIVTPREDEILSNLEQSDRALELIFEELMSEMNFKEDVKTQMRLWPESKKMTLLRQQRIVHAQHQKEAKKEDVSKLFFEGAPLKVYGKSVSMPANLTK